MKFAYFPGCKIPHHLPQYGQAVRAVCQALGVELVDLEFNCCGYPSRHLSFEASMFAAARNLALAAEAGLTILTPCKCCFGNLRHCQHWLEQSDELRGFCVKMLAGEGLALPTRVRTAHLLSVLDVDVGAERIARAVAKPLGGLATAAHYGCHALRPGAVTRFDNPLSPTIFERLLRAIGAEPVDWPQRLECCGNPLWGKNDVMAGRLARRKLLDAEASGAQVLATACTYCQMQFDQERSRLPRQEDLTATPPAVLYAQLLGLALGLEPEVLGLDANRTDPAVAMQAAGR